MVRVTAEQRDATDQISLRVEYELVLTAITWYKGLYTVVLNMVSVYQS